MTQKLKILGVYANEGGCAYYRLIMPLQKLAQLYPDKIEVQFSQNPINLDLETGKMPEDDAVSSAVIRPHGDVG